MSIGTHLALTFLLAGASGPGTSAQSRLGLPLGEKSRLHADVSANIVFDSNVDRIDQNSQTNDPNRGTEDGRLAIKPGLELDVPGRSAELSARVAGTLNYRMGLGAGQVDEFNAGFRGKVKARLGDEGASIQLRLADELVLTPTLINDPGYIGADEQVFTSWINIGRVGVTFRPGGGALELETAYQNQFQFFTNDPNLTQQVLTDSHRHTGIVEVRYRFLPKTKLFFNAGISAFVPVVPEGGVDDTPNSAPINLEGGAIGQITRRISAELAAGYVSTLVFVDGFFSEVDSEANQSTFTMRARLNYAPTDFIKLSTGYRRRADPTIRLNSINLNSADLRADFQLFGRLALHGLFRYNYREFGEQAFTGEDLRSHQFIGDAGFRYYIFDFLNFGTTYRVMVQETNEGPVPVGGTPLLGEFTRHQVIGFLQARY